MLLKIGIILYSNYIDVSDEI